MRQITIGNTSFNLNEFGDFTPLSDIIVETRGGETLDLSAFKYGSVVDLQLGILKDYRGTQNFTPGEYQNVYGTQGGDDIRGSIENNFLFGGGGNDRISGISGNDTLAGGVGNDTIVGGKDNDEIYGGEDNDDITDFNGSNSIYGGTGSDTIHLYGEGDNYVTDGDYEFIGNLLSPSYIKIDTSDKLRGDKIITGNGNDNLFVGGFNDTVSTGGGHDRVFAITSDLSSFNLGSGEDTISVISAEDIKIEGGEGNDDISLAFGYGSLNGGAGDDYISASTGDDKIDGGSGQNIIYGGGGADVFVVTGDKTASFHNIMDFSRAENDKIQFVDTTLKNFQDVRLHSFQFGDNTTIATDNVHVELHNVARSELNALDFIF